MAGEATWTIKSCLDWTRGYLERHGDDKARLAAEWLLTAATGLSRVQLYVNFDRPLTPGELSRLHAMIKRRATGEPLQYITGETAFRMITVACAPGVLIPRPETEMLVDEVLFYLDKRVLNAGADAPRKRAVLDWSHDVADKIAAAQRAQGGADSVTERMGAVAPGEGGAPVAAPGLSADAQGGAAAALGALPTGAASSAQAALGEDDEDENRPVTAVFGSAGFSAEEDEAAAAQSAVAASAGTGAADAAAAEGVPAEGVDAAVAEGATAEGAGSVSSDAEDAGAAGTAGPDTGEAAAADTAPAEPVPAPVARVVEVGCGTGCIGLSLAVERPGAVRVLEIDIAPEACALTRRNRDKLDLSGAVAIRQGDLLTPVRPAERGTFDVLVSNPPYIPTSVMRELPHEVSAFEPALALEGGADGLDVFRRLVQGAPTVLKPGGFFACELHETTLDAAASICRGAGFADVRVVHDLTGRPRFVTARMPEDVAEAPVPQPC